MVNEEKTKRRIKKYIKILLTKHLFKSIFFNLNRKYSTFLQETNSFGNLFHNLTERLIKELCQTLLLKL